MKHYFLVSVLAVFLSLTLSASALAYTWPPEKYEMPRTVLTTETAGESLSGLRDSLRSIGNTGLVILGICLSVFLIPVLFHRLVLENLSFHNRRRKNRFSALDDSIGNEETIGAFEGTGGARRRMEQYESHTGPALEEQLYQREHSYFSGELAGETQRVRPHRRRRL